MSQGLFFTDVTEGAARVPDVGFGAQPGAPGNDGVGILRIEQIPSTYDVLITLDNGRTYQFPLPPGAEGQPGVTPEFVNGEVQFGPLGMVPRLITKRLGVGLFAVSIEIPDYTLAVQAAENAQDSQEAAAGSASAAAGSAGAAATSAGQAEQKVADAAAQVALATAQAGAAATSASEAAAIYDAFDDRYLGPKAANPAADNDGNPLVVGTLFYKTGADPGMRVWTGTLWDKAYAQITGGVQTFKGRDGAVVPQAGDYAVDQVTGALAGPATSTDGAILLADGTDGTKAKDSGIKFGTAPGNAVRLDPTTGRLPAVSGANLTDLPAPRPNRYDNLVILTASQTWTAPAKIRGRVRLIGGFGSGGVARIVNTQRAAAATGGAAPGLCIAEFTANAGEQAAITIGAGGALVSVDPSTSAAMPGQAGGTSRFVGFGRDLTANGGEGGKAAIAGNTTTPASAAGAAGGTATGGDRNYTGGGSGPASAVAGQNAAATGGGALAWFGTAYASGAASATESAASAATGGAGIGGKSADISVNGTTGLGATGGGSAYGPSAGQLGAAGLGGVLTPVSGTANLTLASVTAFGLFNFNGRGGDGNLSYTVTTVRGDPGCGGGALASSAGGSAGTSGLGGLFAGSGGCALNGGGAFSGQGNAPTIAVIGATGGSATTNGATSASSQSAAGGNGLVIIEYDVVA